MIVMPPPRRLSSLVTPFVKFLFAPIWILGFGAGVALMWLDPQGLVSADPGGGTTRVWMTLGFLIGTGFLYWSAISAVRVVLRGDGLLVSNLFVTETIPFADIAEVDQFTWAQPRMITVRFTRRTRLGGSIRFQPRMSLSSIPLGYDDVVGELRALSRGESPD
jgi:hypothetical protein